MGFIGLAPADSLQAAYDTSNRTLILSASGRVQDATYGYHFQRDQDFVGGYRFRLLAASGPIVSPPTYSNYQYSQKFELGLLPGVNEVIIETQNHPEGQAVPLQLFGLGQDSPTATPQVASQQVTGATSGSDAPSSDHITVFLDDTFTIQQSSSIQQGGSVTIQFDPEAVALQNAAVISDPAPSIRWDFKALKAGETTVTVKVYGGIATFAMEIPYQVMVVIPVQQENTVQQ